MIKAENLGAGMMIFQDGRSVGYVERVQFHGERIYAELFEGGSENYRLDADVIVSIPKARPVTGNMCRQCGGMMQRTGACETCSSCGFNTGYG